MEQTEQFEYKWDEANGRLQLWAKTTASTIAKTASGEFFCYFAIHEASSKESCSLFIFHHFIYLFCISYPILYFYFISFHFLLSSHFLHLFIFFFEGIYRFSLANIHLEKLVVFKNAIKKIIKSPYSM